MTSISLAGAAPGASSDRLVLEFSEAIQGASLAGLSLSRDGGPNLLGPDTPAKISGSLLTLSGLGAKLAIPGDYRFRLNSSVASLRDGAGNPVAADAEKAWQTEAAVVLLKRLSDAIADGNTIHAVIRGVAVNNDGAAKASFTAPSVAGQAAVIEAALAQAGVDARSISYVETHGTATPLGDPVEVAALTQAFRRQTADVAFCAIGSVKSNTGHMVIAAGAAGVIKTALALAHERLPGTVHFQRPNPKIDFAGSPFVVQAASAPWPCCALPTPCGCVCRNRP